MDDVKEEERRRKIKKNENQKWKENENKYRIQKITRCKGNKD